jgi:hypothetical protein
MLSGVDFTLAIWYMDGLFCEEDLQIYRRISENPTLRGVF